MSNFNDVVESIKKLNYDEILEVNNITNKFLTEMKREELLNDHKESLNEYQKGKLKFSSNVDELMNELDKLWYQFRLVIHSKRAYKKKIKGDPNLEILFKEKLVTFVNDPFNTSLRTHKLSGKLSDVWSFSLTFKIRITFYFVEQDKVVFESIGSHDEVY